MKKVFLSLFVVCILFSCKKDRFEVQTFFVNSQRVACTGFEGQTQCYQVKVHESDPWQYFYDYIEGFDYEPGYVYRIEVKVYDVPDPLADQSSKRFVLNRIISKQ